MYKMIDERWIGKEFDGSGRSLIEVISPHLGRYVEETTKNLSEYSAS
jgi:hypothetical protein